MKAYLKAQPENEKKGSFGRIDENTFWSTTAATVLMQNRDASWMDGKIQEWSQNARHLGPLEEQITKPPFWKGRYQVSDCEKEGRKAQERALTGGLPSPRREPPTMGERGIVCNGKGLTTLAWRRLIVSGAKWDGEPRATLGERHRVSKTKFS